MSYFSHFPKVNYEVRGDGKYTIMTDITKRVRIKDYIKRSYVNFDFYDVKSGETPEYIANEFYGDSELHWIVLLTNDVIDFYSDWPMTVPQFESFVKSKYDNIDDIHHYEYTQESGDTKFTIELPNESATTLPAGAIAVTNYGYEESVQDKIRRIRLIKPEFVEDIKKEFSRKIKGK